VTTMEEKEALSSEDESGEPQTVTGYVLLEDDKAKIYYELYGKPSCDIKVLLITGFAALFGLWEPLVKQLEKHYHICAFDNRGTGKSEAAVGRYTTKSMARDTLDLMNHLQWEKVHVIGASMGGMIAQELALLAPERLMGGQFAGDGCLLCSEYAIQSTEE
jgi:pimeloyl-ACP methyl ester carboxylesterase